MDNAEDRDAQNEAAELFHANNGLHVKEQTMTERIDRLEKDNANLKALIRSIISAENKTTITFAPLPELTPSDDLYTQMLEGLINECCSLRDVMNYPNGEGILNVVRERVRGKKG